MSSVLMSRPNFKTTLAILAISFAWIGDDACDGTGRGYRRTTEVNLRFRIPHTALIHGEEVVEL
jgi:hypothetical protein